MKLILLPLLLTLLAYSQSASGYRILGVFPLPGHSHWVMKEKLMIGLAKRGHQVDVVTHFPQKKPIPNYRDISIAGSAPRPVNNVTAEEIKGFNSFNMKTFTNMAGTRVCELMETPQLQEIIKNPPKDPPYDLVIIEIFAAPCYMALARHLKVPMIGTATSSLLDWFNDELGNPMNPSFVPCLFSTYNQHMTFWQRLTNTFLSSVITAQINYYTASQRDVVKQHFGIDMPVQDLYKDLSLVLVNSHHSLHGIRPMTHAIVEVGGMHIVDSGEKLAPEVQKWLDDSKDGCVFVTFGSMVRIETFPKELVESFYKAFESIAPVRVLMKIAKKEELLPGLPKNVMTQSWFPQIAVLKHKNTKAFVTHGGLMGTQESIYYGVPMVGIPLFGDQHVNIINYVNKKVAVSLGGPDNVTAENLGEAMTTVLHDPIYRENIKQLSALFKDRPMSALDTGIFWAEYVIRHGNALQSPAIHLTWWQRNLIDVYGFVLLCVGLVLYIGLRLLIAAKKWLCGSKGCSRKAAGKQASKKNQ